MMMAAATAALSLGWPRPVKFGIVFLGFSRQSACRTRSTSHPALADLVRGRGQPVFVPDPKPGIVLYSQWSPHPRDAEHRVLGGLKPAEETSGGENWRAADARRLVDFGPF